MPDFKAVLDFAGDLHDPSHQTPYKKILQDKFIYTVEDKEINKLDRLLTKTAPDAYKPIPKTQWKERKTIHETALNHLFSLSERYANMDSYNEAFGLDARNCNSLLHYGPNQADNERENSKIVNILTHGTADEQRELFYDTMKRMASVDAEKIRRYTDKELVENMEDIMPTLLIGYEGENLLKIFKSKNFQITPEEEQQFKALKGCLNNLCTTSLYKLNAITSPVYEKIDLQAISGFPADRKNAVIEGLSQYHSSPNPAMSELFLMVTNIRNQDQAEYNSQMLQVLKLSDDKTISLGISPSRDRNRHPSPSEPRAYYGSTLDFIDDLRAGKTVYIYDGSDKEGEIKAVRDFSGNGLLTEVPDPVKKPGLFTRFKDSVMRFFGNKEGIKECRDYENYEAQMKQLAKSAKTQKYHFGFVEAQEKMKIPKEEWIKAQKATVKDDFTRSHDQKVNEIKNIESKVEEMNTAFLREFDSKPEKMDNPKELSAKLTKAFTDSLKKLRNETNPMAKNAADLYLCGKILDTLKDKPELNKNFKINEKDIAEYQGRKNFADLQLKNLKAEGDLLNEGATEKELPREKREQCLADIAMFRVMEASIKTQNANSGYTALKDTNFDLIEKTLKKSDLIQNLVTLPAEKLAGKVSSPKELKTFGQEAVKTLKKWQNEKNKTMSEMKKKVKQTEASKEATKKAGKEAGKEAPVVKGRTRSNSMHIPSNSMRI